MSNVSLSVNSINALIWTFDAVAIAFTAGRLYIRGRVLKRFGWDDAVHIFAALCMIIQTAIYTGAASLAESVREYLAGKSDIPPNLVQYLQINIANTVITFTCYWAVKLSIMLFYRKLFGISVGFMRAWWIVLSYLFLSYWVVIATALVQCGGNGLKITDVATCTSKETKILDEKIFKTSFAMNISSDLFIMALPLSRIPRLRIGIVQKIGVGIIFSLSFVVIALELVRLVFSLKGTGTSVNVVWTSTEASVAVIISCLPSFSALINYREKAQSRGTAPYDRLAASKATSKNKTQSAKNVTDDRSNKSFSETLEAIPLEDYTNV